MGTERGAEKSQTPQEQLRSPRRLRIEKGDVIEATSSKGVVRIIFTDELRVEVEATPFERERIARERALLALGRQLAPYVNARLTEAGLQHVDPDQGYYAQMDATQRQGGLKNTFISLLRQRIPEIEIEREVEMLVLGKGGAPEIHMGIPHPTLKNINTDLINLLKEAVEEWEQSTQPRQRRRSAI